MKVKCIVEEHEKEGWRWRWKGKGGFFFFSSPSFLHSLPHKTVFHFCFFFFDCFVSSDSPCPPLSFFFFWVGKDEVTKELWITMSVVLWSIIFDYGGCTCFDVTVFSFFFPPFHSAEKRKKKKITITNMHLFSVNLPRVVVEDWHVSCTAPYGC